MSLNRPRKLTTEQKISSSPLLQQTSVFKNNILPHLDSKALHCLLRVSVATKTLTSHEIDQRQAKQIIDLTLRGEVTEVFLMKSPCSQWEPSSERLLRLYKNAAGLVYYFYKNDPTPYYVVDKKSQPLDFTAYAFESSQYQKWCVCESLRKSVFDITTRRGHTHRSDSEAIKEMVRTNPQLPFVVYHPNQEKDKKIRNRGGQLICLKGKTPLQVAFGEEHDYAIKAMTDSLLNVPDAKQRQINAEKIQAQRDAQYAPGSESEEKQKADRWQNVISAHNNLIQTVLDSKLEDIQDSGKKLILQGIGGDAIAHASAQLEETLQAVRNAMIRTGPHFNPKLLLHAYSEYKFDKETFLKMRFLYRNLGRYQRMMSLGYAHGFSGRGLEYNVNHLRNGKTPRESISVSIVDDSEPVWMAVDLYSIKDLGINVAISNLSYTSGAGNVEAKLLENLITFKNNKRTYPILFNFDENKPAALPIK